MSLDDIKSFSKENMAFDPTGHDFLHAQRVAKLAQKIYTEDFKKDATDILSLIHISEPTRLL